MAGGDAALQVIVGAWFHGLQALVVFVLGGQLAVAAGDAAGAVCPEALDSFLLQFLCGCGDKLHPGGFCVGGVVGVQPAAALRRVPAVGSPVILRDVEFAAHPQPRRPMLICLIRLDAIGRSLYKAVKRCFEKCVLHHTTNNE